MIVLVCSYKFIIIIMHASVKLNSNTNELRKCNVFYACHLPGSYFVGFIDGKFFTMYEFISDSVHQYYTFFISNLKFFPIVCHIFSDICYAIILILFKKKFTN